MQSLTTALFIAYKSITRGRSSTFALMMLILCLSFFNMIFVPSVFSGLLSTIIHLEINTYTAHVMVQPQQDPLPKRFINGEAQFRKEIETIPGVVGTARTYLTAGSISYVRQGK
jgi:ABC-type lipoprotein release transport system permease subunit